MTAQQSQHPAPLRGDGETPFQTDALSTQLPDHVPAILPVKGFPDDEEQWGSVLYECPVTSCPFTVGAAGHGHPHFLFAWSTCPPRDAVDPATLTAVIEIVEPDCVEEFTAEFLPHIRGRYDGLYEGAAAVTITEFANPPSAGPAVHPCPDCGARTNRYPVYVWPEPFEVPAWWDPALAAYDGPVWSPKDATAQNPTISEEATSAPDSHSAADITAF